MNRREKGYGNYIADGEKKHKAHFAKFDLTVYKRVGGKGNYYNNLTTLDFGAFNVAELPQSLPYKTDYVLFFKTVKDGKCKKTYVPCSFDDLFGICFNSRILRSVPECLQDVLMAKHIKENEYLKFVFFDNEVMFFQANKSKGERNEYRIAY